MAKDKTGSTAATQTGTDTPVVKPPRYISTGFSLRSRDYPAGMPLDNLAESDLRELIDAGHAAPETTEEPAPAATTTEE